MHSTFELPAVCDTCGTVFASGFALGKGVSAVLRGNKSGPCPNCGGMGSVPDGIYEFVDEAEKIISSWSPIRRQRLAEEVAAARDSRNRAAATQAITRDSRLGAVAQRFLVPRNAGDFWALVSVLLAIAALVGSQSSPSLTVNMNKPGPNKTWTGNPESPSSPGPKAQDKMAPKKSKSRRRK